MNKSSRYVLALAGGALSAGVLGGALWFLQRTREPAPLLSSAEPQDWIKRRYSAEVRYDDAAPNARAPSSEDERRRLELFPELEAPLQKSRTRTAATH